MDYYTKDGRPISKGRLLKGRTKEQKWVIKYFFSNPSNSMDQKYKEYVDSQFAGIDFYSKAINAIGVDEDELKEINPVTFANYEFEDEYQKAYAKQLKKKEVVVNPQTHKKYKRYVWVTSKYKIVWMFFSDKQVFIYEYRMNIDEGTINEKVYEYFYKDITSVSSVNKVVQAITPTGPMNTNVNQFEIVVPGAKFACSIEENIDMNSIIQGMRQKIREKKSSSI